MTKPAKTKKAKANYLRRYGLPLVCGMLASLALPPLGILLGLFALSLPFMASANLAQDKSSSHQTDFRQAVILGWLTGTGWFLFSLSWISNALITSGGFHLALIPFSLLGLPLFLGLFWAAAFGLAHVITIKARFDSILHLTVLIIMISVFEYGRGFILTGFPWNAPGLVLANHAIGLKIASVIGTWGGSLLILIMAGLPAMVALGGRAFGLAGLGLLVLIGGGSQFVQNPQITSPHDQMMTRIIQPNISQSEKWIFAKRQKHLADLITASRQPSDNPLELIIWPETAFAGIYERERGVVSAITHASSQGRIPLITGILSAREDPFTLYNAAMLFDGRGQLKSGVAKRHLVPFGEYVPFRSLFPFAGAIVGPTDFTSGEGAQSLLIPRQNQGNEDEAKTIVKALTLICYEVIFPGAVRDAVLKENPNIMIVITNDAWFGDSIGPRQHLAMAQMRAAELGLPLLRSANNGISALIGSDGRILKSLDYNQTGYVDGQLPAARQTIYRLIGDSAYFGVLILFAFTGFCLRLTSAKRNE